MIDILLGLHSWDLEGGRTAYISSRFLGHTTSVSYPKSQEIQCNSILSLLSLFKVCFAFISKLPYNDSCTNEIFSPQWLC